MVMPTYEPLNSVPRIWSTGTKDESTRPLVAQVQVVPMHAPLFFSYAEKGPLDARFGSAGTHRELYGNKMFDEKSKYATIVTPYLNLLAEYNNPFFIQRLKPKNAKDEAVLCLALEVIETDKYKDIKRDPVSNQFDYSPSMHVEYLDTETRGYYCQWKVITLRDSELGQQNSIPGSLKYHNDPDAVSRIYPIMEFKASWFGSEGNNIGLRLYAPTIKSRIPTNTRVIEDQKAFLYRAEIVKREDPYAQPTTIKTNFDDKYVQFAFKEGAFDITAGSASIAFDEIFLDQYRDMRGGTRPIKYGDLGEVHVYRENLDMLLEKFFIAEAMVGGLKDFGGIGPQEGKHLINFFNGTDHKGVPYHAVFIANELDGSPVTLTEKSVHYLRGGDDGTMGNAAYDELCREQFKFFGDLDVSYRDMGHYPIRQIYDVGFSSKTKEFMFTPLGRRMDINVTMSTYDFATDAKTKTKKPSLITESSRGFALQQIARSYVESEIHGTGCMRALIVPQCGRIANNPKYRYYLPMTYEVLRMRAEYMAQPRGMKPGLGYDAPPYNEVRVMTDVSNPYAPAAVYEANWENGMTYFGHKSDKVLFCPGMRTVYKDNTSVLMSDITMQIVCDINYICFQVWTELSGNSKLTDEQFIEKSNRMIEDRCRGRYDDRVVIKPNTFFSEKDKAQGYSWHCVVDMYANNMRTVDCSFVVAHRMGDYNG